MANKVVSMGIGSLGNDKVEFKRKFRWIFKVLEHDSNEGVIADNYLLGHVCKVAARPSIQFATQEVEHLIERVGLPAKAAWNPVQITLYDVKGQSFVYQWISQFYDPILGSSKPMADLIEGAMNKYPKKLGILQLLDSKAKVMEQWEFQGCWPSQVDFGTVDYSSSETLDISLTLHYDRAILKQYSQPGS